VCRVIGIVAPKGKRNEWKEERAALHFGKEWKIIQKDREKRRNARPSLWNEGKKRNHEV
jgi:hypothetical protein